MNGHVAERFTRTTQNRVGLSHVGSNPTMPTIRDKNLLAYVIGLAIGDGNLSNPNGRATRLRISYDTKYPNLINKIIRSIKTLLPNNRVSPVKRKGNCLDVSCYSNQWETLLGWYVGKGSKIVQRVTIPKWIQQNEQYKINCIRGLVETDGTIYTDRGYKAVMFVSAIPKLANDFYSIIQSFGFAPHMYKIKRKNPASKAIYHIRISKDVDRFLNLIHPEKS